GGAGMGSWPGPARSKLSFSSPSSGHCRSRCSDRGPSIISGGSTIETPWTSRCLPTLPKARPSSSIYKAMEFHFRRFAARFPEWLRVRIFISACHRIATEWKELLNLECGDLSPLWGSLDAAVESSADKSAHSKPRHYRVKSYSSARFALRSSLLNLVQSFLRLDDHVPELN